MIDYLIVGQGTAGTMLAYFFSKTTASYKVLDDNNSTSSSFVAAGIVNPITGKRYVKSWRIDEFLPFAKQTYLELSQLIEQNIIVERNILRMLINEGQENDWYARTASEGYEQYFVNEPKFNQLDNFINPVYSYGEIKKSFQVKLYDLLPKYRKLLESKELFIEDHFDFSLLKVYDDHIAYRGVDYKNIIFAEGYRVISNPYFNALPFRPVKGEIFLVKIPDFNCSHMIKHQLFIVPLYDDIYWVGSNYEWDFQDHLPSPEKAISMKAVLDNILKVPFEIIEHKAGVRPSFKNRRPTILHHPKHSNLILFNGFGAKGTSLIPYWADHLVKHLINAEKIDKEVSVLKYIDLLI